MTILGLLILLATVSVVILFTKIARGKLWWLWILCIPIVLLGFFFTLGTTISDAPTVNCKNNLKSIGVALHMYAQDYNDKFPDRLLDLYPKYLGNLTVFICSAKHPEPVDYSPDKSKDPFSDPFYKKMLSEEYMDYQYTKELTEKSSPTAIFAQDKKGNNHRQGSFNVLYLDGHVETKGIPPWYRNFYFKMPLPD